MKYKKDLEEYEIIELKEGSNRESIIYVYKKGGQNMLDDVFEEINKFEEQDLITPARNLLNKLKRELEKLK